MKTALIIIALIILTGCEPNPCHDANSCNTLLMMAYENGWIHGSNAAVAAANEGRDWSPDASIPYFLKDSLEFSRVINPKE